MPTRAVRHEEPMPSDVSVVTAVALGVVGGAYVAKVAIEHLFVHGLTKDEKRGIMLGVATASSLLAAKQFFGLDEETVTKKISEIVGE